MKLSTEKKLEILNEMMGMLEFSDKEKRMFIRSIQAELGDIPKEETQTEMELSFFYADGNIGPYVFGKEKLGLVLSKTPLFILGIPIWCKDNATVEEAKAELIRHKWNNSAISYEWKLPNELDTAYLRANSSKINLHMQIIGARSIPDLTKIDILTYDGNPITEKYQVWYIIKD